MNMNLVFVINSILFGVGLAMDAFSVSMTNGLSEPDMKRKRMCLIAGTFSGFQIIMPLAGWICVHKIAEIFASFQKLIPWIALGLLGYIGGKMLYEGIKNKESGENLPVGIGALMVQGIATSIDALSVGFTISDYNFTMALIESCIIGVVTFVICFAGIIIGRIFGNRLSGRASVLGGCILIAIGIEIFVKNIFF